jgi:phosphoserine phosphatase
VFIRPILTISFFKYIHYKFHKNATKMLYIGQDVLADSLGKGVEVAAWTAKAMGGDVKFEDALSARLEIIKPSRASIEQCLVDHPLVLSKGVEDLIKALQQRGTHVYLVSGGFRIMIEPVAEILNIPKDRIFANGIFFDEDGKYVGFDADEPTSADGGKPKALRLIEEQGKYKTMVMVGDGATDAQAKPPAKAFVGFGGVIVRDVVKEKACWYVMDFDEMISIVKSNP